MALRSTSEEGTLTITSNSYPSATFASACRFVAEYPSMRDLSLRQDHFKAVLLDFCRQTLSDRQVYAKAKLVVGAGLSIGDLFTDILMCFEVRMGKRCEATW